MKKCFLLLLCLALAVGCLPALAAYDKEITFMDIPWGDTDNEAFYQALLERNLTDLDNAEDFYEEECSDNWAELYYLPEDMNFSTYPGAIDFDFAYNPDFTALADYYALDNDEGAISIGDQVPNMAEFFLFHGLEDGKIDPEKKTFLSVVLQFFFGADLDAVTQALTAQYGACGYQKTSEFDESISIWYGANGTAVAVLAVDGAVARIFYTNTGLEARIQAMLADLE